MSIKDQLRAAILSGGATASMPSTNAIVIPSGRYIAPTNGYVCVQANGSQLASFVAVTLDQGVQQIITAAAVGQGLAAYIPIGKGQSVTTIATEFSAVDCLFVKLVGGGKSPVAQSLWRVVPCLRNYFVKRLTPILKASLHGLQRKQLRQGSELLKSRFQVLMGAQSTTHQKLVGTTSNASLGREGSVASISFPTTERCGCPTTLAGKTLRIYLPLMRLFRKGQESLSGCMLSLPRTQGSFPLSAVNKPVLGGLS